MVFMKIVRGAEVEIHADNWQQDHSVGISLYPEEVWATLDGQPFELTDDEIEQISIEATEVYLDQQDYE